MKKINSTAKVWQGFENKLLFVQTIGLSNNIQTKTHPQRQFIVPKTKGLQFPTQGVWF